VNTKELRRQFSAIALKKFDAAIPEVAADMLAKAAADALESGNAPASIALKIASETVREHGTVALARLTDCIGDVLAGKSASVDPDVLDALPADKLTALATAAQDMEAEDVRKVGDFVAAVRKAAVAVMRVLPAVLT
jgi:hypothetical protein